MLAATVSGCAVFGAGREAVAPPLAVPEAPPRDVAEFPPAVVSATEVPVFGEPLENEAAVEAEVVAEVVPEPEPAPAPEPEVAADAVPEPDAGETPLLELTPDPEEDVDAAVVRRGLRSTAQILDDIDLASLTAAGRAQRDTARRFLSQATTALRAGNITFAHYLNEKAETLARDLQNR
jgi:hypothetical protein